MFKIDVKSFLSIFSAKFIGSLSKLFFKGGSNFPGKVALKFDKNILEIVAKEYKVILITGTNGKTTTTSMIYNMLKDSNKTVITNNTGANMLPGITACFVENYKFKQSKKEKFAVIEVDEANLKFVTKYISPNVISITNLFRDQLDRYGEVYTTLNKILEGVIDSPSSTLILNGDESLLGDLTLPNDIKYFGITCEVENANTKIDINADSKFCKKCKHPYKYTSITYNHLGEYYCENCGYRRPKLQFEVNKIKELTPSGSLIYMDNNEYFINQPGVYNIYNALCAYSIAKTLNIDNSTIYNSLKSQTSSFGRQESIKILNTNVKIILVKNPAGFDQAINTISLDKKNLNLGFLLNDNYADGRDVSWIWDVNFEKLKSLNTNQILIAGERKYDMAIRLKIAGLDSSKFIINNNYDEYLKNIESSTSDDFYILATYTAMISFRKFLYNKKIIKKLW